MKCHILWHFIWVFTVCESTFLEVSSIQRVNKVKCEDVYKYMVHDKSTNMFVNNSKMIGATLDCVNIYMKNNATFSAINTKVFTRDV